MILCIMGHYAQRLGKQRRPARLSHLQMTGGMERPQSSFSETELSLFAVLRAVLVTVTSFAFSCFLLL